MATDVPRTASAAFRSEGLIYPVIVRIGDFEITSFGVLVAIAALVGYLLFDRERKRDGLSDRVPDAAMAGLVGGIFGAKLVWAIEHAGRQGPFLDLLLSRGGLSWFGGFAGGLLAGLAVLRAGGVPLIPALAAATPALAVAHAIGRIGCFLVGDDYGLPSTLPWAVAFPEGLPPTTTPVHPTQLYEMAVLFVIAWALVRWRRQHRPATFVLGMYLVTTATTRFLIEFLRTRVPIAGPFAVAHVWAGLVVIAGIVVLAWPRGAVAPPASAGRAR